MANTKYDGALLEILKGEGQLVPFLDTVFGFLYRCTDFYHIQKDPSEKLGFPPGLAREIVLKILQKWEGEARAEEQAFCERKLTTEDTSETVNNSELVEETSRDTVKDSVIPVAKEVEVESSAEEGTETPAANESEEQTEQKAFQSTGDSYNGAVRDGYRWAQTISDIDVQVTVPPYVRKGRNVRVDVTATTLSVSILEENSSDQWRSLVYGELCHRTNKDDSVWSLVPGQYVQLHLEKTGDRWWDALFVSEPKIDLKNIDASRPMDDLSQEEQMKIQELMWNHERKQKGLPTSDEMDMQKIMKEAWDKEGSPFLGKPYDPNMVKYVTSPGNF
ncbi:nudC domain-containing protein 3 [Anabrus simplex]|uniref:nudC domain-containing protein 3 n=1 Tax=Anabrus simplex TaxID=316456 RepID=UPI0034DDB6E1